jgi:hypothetical protein
LKMVALAVVLTHCAALVAAATPVEISKSTAAKYQAERAEAVRALAARPDANSLATAAALNFFGWRAQPPPPPSSLELIARASDLAPENAGISWLHLQLCAATPNCDTRDLATVLRWIDPDNSAAWISTLAAAQKDKDTIEVDRVVADMARGTRFDLYFNQLIVLMFDALGGVQHQVHGTYAGSDAVRFVALVGIAAAEIVPPLKPLTDACRESIAGTERREDCLKVARIMQRGDTVIIQMLGYSIEKRFLPPDSKEARSLAERRSLLEWRSLTAGKLDLSILPWTQNARTRARIAEMRLRPREEDVCIALLRAHKMALEPAENPR